MISVQRFIPFCEYKSNVYVVFMSQRHWGFQCHLTRFSTCTSVTPNGINKCAKHERHTNVWITITLYLSRCYISIKLLIIIMFVGFKEKY